MLNELTVTKFDHLTNPAAPPPQHDDAWSAVILMFHDHDWETALLTQALVSDAFYIGAMGSERTHDLRCAALKGAGLSTEDISRIKGPIGLIPSMRDANLLALSTLADIVKTRRADEKKRRNTTQRMSVASQSRFEMFLKRVRKTILFFRLSNAVLPPPEMR